MLNITITCMVWLEMHSIIYCVKLQSNSGFQLVHVIVYNGFTLRWRPIYKYKQIIIMNF